MASVQRASPIPRPYKDSLTPVLHRRFTRAASIALLLCYAQALLIGGETSYFWYWFPIGPAGIRTLLLFISAFSIFILRVAQLHVARRTTKFSFESFWICLNSLDAARTLFWYLFSAWWFSEVYVWCAPKHAELTWVVHSKPYERLQLNERPIYLRSMVYLLAIAQTCIHLFYDYDRISLPSSRTSLNENYNGQERHPSTPIEKLKWELLRRVHSCFQRCLTVIIVGSPLYYLGIRRIAWSSSLFFAKVFWKLPRSSSTPPTLPPFQISLLARSVFSCFLLTLLWEVTVVSFGVYVAQEPLKRGQPLTNDSRDPNGTLVAGLKAKKQVPQAFAFWELRCITERFPLRRKTFFEDIDRPGGPSWGPILKACSGVIEATNSRLLRGPDSSPPNSEPAKPQAQQSSIQSLPHIATPLKDDPILTRAPPPATRIDKVEQSVGDFARKQGQKHSESTFDFSPLGLTLWLFRFCVDNTLSPETKQKFKKSQLKQEFDKYKLELVKSPLGVPFRQPIKRRAAATLLGSPYGDLSIIVNAVESISRLATSSVEDDSYGKAQADIANIIKSFTRTINNLEHFKKSLKPHWTDVEAERHTGEENFEEANVLLRALRSELAQLVEVFDQYANDLGLSYKDMREAKEAKG